MATTALPEFDAAAAYPPLAVARQALSKQDWPALRNIMAGLDWTGRSAVMREIGDAESAVAFLRPVVEADATDLLAATALANALIAAGWRIRTTKRAQYVSRAQFAALRDHLRKAEQILIDVTARDPAAVLAWQARLTTARGLELGQNEARRRYDQGAKAAPHYVPAQRSMVQQLCPKWSGSFEAAHAFASECAANAPDGAHNAIVVVDAHIEHWLDLGPEKGGGYWRNPAVRHEIRAIAERSVLHPNFSYAWGWVDAQSSFAAALCLIEDLPAAAHCFQALGPHGSENPWEYIGTDAPATFRSHRAKALAAAGVPA